MELSNLTLNIFTTDKHTIHKIITGIEIAKRKAYIDSGLERNTGQRIWMKKKVF